MSHRVAGILSIVALVLGLAADPALAQSTPHSTPKSCNYSGGSSCPDSTPYLSPYLYYGTSAWNTDQYGSADDVMDWVLAHQTSPVSWCTGSYTTPTLSNPDVSETLGVVTGQSYTSSVTVNGQHSSSPPCTVPPTYTFTQQISAYRTLSCPSGFTLGYQSSPRLGPYCSIGSYPIPEKQAGCPTCSGTSGGSNSGAASAGSGASSLNSPVVDISNGNKYQIETDYAGTGNNTLKFVRTYSSQNVQCLPKSGAGGQRIGGGWSATYFQALLPVTITDSSTTYNTVYALRPDGRVLTFNLYGGVYSPDGDVSDSLMATGTGWIYQTADDTLETYNSAGQLLSVATRGHAPVTVTYAPDAGPGDGPASVSDAFGHTLSFTYAPNATTFTVTLVSMTDPAGNTVSYGFDSSGYGQLKTVTQTDGTTRTYGYDGGSCRLTGITDESSVVYASWTYSGGVPVTSQLAGGVGAYSFSYSTGGSTGTVTATDPLGKVRTYGQSLIWGAYRTTSVSALCPGCGEDASRTFDANGNVATRTDFNGNKSTYVYDVTQNQETSRTEGLTSGGGTTAQTRTITTQWETAWRQPNLIEVYAGATATGTPLRTTAYTHDSMGNVLTKTVTDTTVTPNVTRVWTYTYDTYGRLLSAQGPRTDVSSTTYYTYYTCSTGSQCGQLQTVTDPVGNVTTYNTYNVHGQPLTITDPNGTVTTLTYDNRSRLTSRQVGTETTSFTYWPTGLLKKVTLPDSSYVQYTYDNAHRLNQISDGAGNSIQYTLDNMGNRTGENTYDPSSTLHRTHSRVYNTLNQLYKDINAAGTSAVTTIYGYDSNGNQNSIAAPLSRTTANTYDPLNRLNQITDPASGVTGFVYDANDNLTSVTDPRSLTTNYGYNGFGDVKTLSSPDTGSSSNTYDSGGNVSVATDARGATSNYTYDAANRVTQIVYKNSSSVVDQTLVFGYDSGTNGKGHLTSASDANHSISWTYDALGRVSGRGLTIGTVNLSTGYAYTSGDLTAIVTPSGQGITYTYNSNHQVTGVAVNGTTVLSGATYEPFGGINGWTWGNSTTVSRTYNGDGLISQIVTAGVTLGYSFDYANRITGISDSSNSALTWSYGYDLLDRLNSATTSAITDGWTYDANGNRLTQTGATPVTYTMSPTSNQVTATSGSLVRSYSYDAAGNVTSNGTSFVYNDRGRMASTSGSSTLYLYNALGQMIEKSGTLGTAIFMQDEAGHLIGEYDGSGNLVQETVWLGDMPVATLRPNGSGGVNIFYVHTDHLNTPRKVSQPSSNTLEWRWDADPFGTTADNQNPAGLGTFIYNLRFPGQYYQAETALNQNWNRDYDPLAAKYIESDPIGLRSGVNTYAYVWSRPSMLRDSTGLSVDPKQTCIDGLGIKCSGQQDNPSVPGTPDKPSKRKLPDNDYCAKRSINYQGCLTCCSGIAATNPEVYELNWHGLCNTECAFQFTGCPRRKDPGAAVASLDGF